MGDFVRQAQALLFLEVAADFMEKHDVPLIVGGDFNSDPRSAACSLMYHNKKLEGEVPIEDREANTPYTRDEHMKWYDVTNKMFDDQAPRLTKRSLNSAYEFYNKKLDEGAPRDKYRSGFPEVTT